MVKRPWRTLLIGLAILIPLQLFYWLPEIMGGS